MFRRIDVSKYGNITVYGSLRNIHKNQKRELIARRLIFYGAPKRNVHKTETTIPSQTFGRTITSMYGIQNSHIILKRTNISQGTTFQPRYISSSSKPFQVLQDARDAVEVSDPPLIFDEVYNELENEFGKENMMFPKEIMWLGGAPGSGKGTNTKFICSVRGITAPPIVVSSLLNSPRAKAIKDAGGLVGDREVAHALFETLLKPEYATGVIVDGFPRTKVQVDIVKLFYDRMQVLRREYQDTTAAEKFPRPIFRICLLYVSQKESVERQLARGEQTKKKNREFIAKGRHDLVEEERMTDYSAELARKRFSAFKEQTFDALNSLKEHFLFHFINAKGTIKDVQKNIARELDYQSSLELHDTTFSLIHPIPLASEITLHARQNLVKRLDHYATKEKELLSKVLLLINDEIMPVVKGHAFSGRAHVSSTNCILQEHSNASQMIIDILSERGFEIVAHKKYNFISKVLKEDESVQVNDNKAYYDFFIRFSKAQLRHNE